MTKGEVYRLVEAEGRRLLFIPLALLPALTGIVSDNRYQFDEDCWQEMVKEVLNMPSYGLDDSVQESFDLEIPTDDIYSWNASPVPDGELWLIKHITYRHTTGANAALSFYAYPTGDVYYLLNIDPACESHVWKPYTVNVCLGKGDRLYFYGSFSQGGGIWYIRYWGEKWKI